MLTVSELKAILAVPKNELVSYATGTDPANPFTLPPPFKFQESLRLFADYLQSMENFLGNRSGGNPQRIPTNS